MTVAPGPGQAKKPLDGVSFTNRAPRTLQPIEALIARRRLGALGIEKGIKGAAFMVWSFLLDSTICWQRIEERHFHSYIAAQTGLSKRAVETAVVALREAGLIAYEAGRPSQKEGRNVPSRFTILHVQDVLGDGVPHADVIPVPHAEVVPPHEGSPLPHDDVTPSPMTVGHPASLACGTVPQRDVAYRGENCSGEELARENVGVGAEIVPLKPEVHPAPDARAVLAAYCEAMAEAETPVVKAGALLAPIAESLGAGCSAQMVLIGLGMWEAEGYLVPRQLPEWVGKAARQGAAPTQAMEVIDLLSEGKARYQRFLSRRTVAAPSRADLRRARSLAAIHAYNNEET